MVDLKALNEKVTASVAKQDGSWQAKKEMLDAIEELRIAAMGPGEYITGIRYQVGLSVPARGVVVMEACDNTT